MTGVASVTGSAAGENTFRAGSGNESFAQTGPGVAGRHRLLGGVTSSTSPLTVNVSGGPWAGSANDSASVGTTTYTFATGGAAFTSFTGANTGNTEFLADGSGGYALMLREGTTTVDFSAASSGVNVNLSPNTEGGVPSGQADVPGGVDMVSGLTTSWARRRAATPSPLDRPGRTPSAGAGTGNRFVAGTGDATFIDPTSGNTWTSPP